MSPPSTLPSPGVVTEGLVERLSGLDLNAFAGPRNGAIYLVLRVEAEAAPPGIVRVRPGGRGASAAGPFAGVC